MKTDEAIEIARTLASLGVDIPSPSWRQRVSAVVFDEAGAPLKFDPRGDVTIGHVLIIRGGIQYRIRPVGGSQIEVSVQYDGQAQRHYVPDLQRGKRNAVVIGWRYSPSPFWWWVRERFERLVRWWR